MKKKNPGQSWLINKEKKDNPDLLVFLYLSSPF